MGTNRVEDMAGLDVIFVGVGAPRKKGQTRRDLLEINTKLIADTSIAIRDLYEGCDLDGQPILVYMGNPVTSVTWVGYKVSGFKKQNVMGQAGNLDSRRICHAISEVLGLSVNAVRGIVFGEHGDSMVADPSFFSVSGIPLDTFLVSEGIDRGRITAVIENMKKGGTHYVNQVGQSASAGPARAVCEMLRCVITGISEVQPVVAIIEDEYGLIRKEDGLESMSFGVPAKIGPNGVEKICELPVENIREKIETSAEIIKQDIRSVKGILEQEYGIK
jgi:malate dehydrogenase